MLKKFERYRSTNQRRIWPIKKGSWEIKEKIINNCKQLNIPIIFFETDIFKITNKHSGKHPCYLCARMRRGALYTKAAELGCNKIALGHHQNDVAETVLMNIIYNGDFRTMMPKLKSKNFNEMELIRPLYLIKKKVLLLGKSIMI